MTRTIRPASEKQTALIVRLAGEKDTAHFAEDRSRDLTRRARRSRDFLA